MIISPIYKNNMRHILLSLILVLGFSRTATGQTPVTIKTPTNVSVDALSFAEFSSSQLASLEAAAASWITQNGSSAQRVAPASARYNCHAYAWHTKDGGNLVWVNAHATAGNNDPSNLKKYWSGSAPTYAVMPQSVSTIAYYGSCWVFVGNQWENACDHSAEVLSTNLFESKWGRWPRYRHSPIDNPYNSSSIIYYGLQINGNQTSCFSAQSYSALSIPSATYTWTGTRTSILGSGHSVSVTGTSAGQGNISVSISSPHSLTTIRGRRNIWVGVPQTINTISGSTFTYELTYTSYTASVAPGATSYNWQFPSGWTGSGSQPSNIAFTTIGPNSGTIFVTPQNQCGTNGNASLFVTVASCQNCRTIEVFPNPGNDYISVTPKTLNEEIIPRFEIISYFIVNLQGRIVIKSEDGVLINPHAIEVVGLPKGNYVIHCKLANGESYTKRLLIER